MLGDNPERSKNPLKKARRRRNAKAVQFTTPTYYEASDIDWSDEEADEQQLAGANGAETGRQAHQSERDELAANEQSAAEEALEARDTSTEGPNSHDSPLAQDMAPSSEQDLSSDTLEAASDSTGDSHILSLKVPILTVIRIAS